MTAGATPASPAPVRPLVLFVGAGSDGRARIAAALLDHLAGERYSALAAGPGTAAGAELPAAVAEILAADGVDLNRAAGATLTPRLAASAQRVIFIGPPEEHPPALTLAFERWGVPAPDGRDAAEAKIICDTLARLVQRLIARLDTEALVT